MEAARPAVIWDSLSEEALEQYCKRSEIDEAIDSEEFKLRLQRQGLLTLDEDVLKPTGFANILFGVNPRDSTPQAAVLGTIHYPDNKEESRDFDGPQVLVPELARSWLKDKLPNVMDRSDAVRKDANEVVFTLIREGLVNAIVHRDYDVEQAKCQLVVHPSHIEIHSPGEPVDPVTLEQLQSFDAPMLSRNPVMHFVFTKMGLAEERGLGLRTLREKTLEIGRKRTMNGS